MRTKTTYLGVVRESMVYGNPEPEAHRLPVGLRLAHLSHSIVGLRSNFLAFQRDR